jgi:hypothetical protein
MISIEDASAIVFMKSLDKQWNVKPNTGGRAMAERRRYKPNFANKMLMPDGRFEMAVTDPNFAETIGHIVTEWPVLEEAMITVMAALLGDIFDAPARQVFRSLNSERVRLTVMRSLLHDAHINKDKGAIYDEVLDEFASLNTRPMGHP